MKRRSDVILMGIFAACILLFQNCEVPEGMEAASYLEQWKKDKEASTDKEKDDEMVNLPGTGEDLVGNEELPTPTPTATPVVVAPTPIPEMPTTVTIEDGRELPKDCGLLAAELQKYPDAKVKSFLSFGGKGDGKSDEYMAFQAMASAMSKKQNATRQVVYFPKGNYYIDRFIRPNNGNKVVAIEGSSNFSIIGCSAKVDVKGDFEMVNDRLHTNGYYYSDTKQLTPFIFSKSSNFKFAGFEIDGNVDKMTRQGADKVAETSSHGIITGASKDYEISDIKIHHFAGDGIYIGGSAQADENVLINNVVSSNNARQGLSIIQAANVKVTNSSFLYTGVTGGAYPGHSPQAGVDIEPNIADFEGASSKTKNIVFENCVFENNRGSQFVTGGDAVTIENVTIRKSRIKAAVDSFQYVVILSVPNGVIEDSVIDTGAGAIFPAWARANQDKTNTILRRNTIISSGSGLVLSIPETQVVIDGNTFVGMQDPVAFRSYFPYIQKGVVQFTNNKINYDTKNFGTARRTVGLVRVPVVTGNEFTTNGQDFTVAISDGFNAAANKASAGIKFAK